MRQGRNQLRVINRTNGTGDPTGGSVEGMGVLIAWQDGPLGRGDEEKEPNGAFVEDVLVAALQRIEFYQEAAGGRYACRQNALAITRIQEALFWCRDRREDREIRGVQGTHQP